MSTAYVVTQTFHHDGMDTEDDRVWGIFTDKERADAVAYVCSEQWKIIAHDAEIEEVTLDEFDPEDFGEWVESFHEHNKLEGEDNPALVGALDLLWSNWREFLDDESDPD